jgi:hypothetical protein
LPNNIISQAPDSAALGGDSAAAYTTDLEFESILFGLDGPGSGLDADSLDGIDASQFLGSTDKAADADTVDGMDSSEFLTARLFTTQVTRDYGPIAPDYCLGDEIRITPIPPDSLIFGNNLAFVKTGGNGQPAVYGFDVSVVQGRLYYDNFGQPNQELVAAFDIQVCNLTDTTHDLPSTSLTLMVIEPT